MPILKTKTAKVAKKAPAKKAAAAKKPTKKAISKKSLVYATDAESFWVVDGQILNSLVSLGEALSSMEKEVYAHHVTKEKNDFADWVEKVLADVECAMSLRSAKTPRTAKTIVVTHLKTYTA